MAFMLLWLIRKALTREITKPNKREYSATLKFSSSPDALATPMIVSTKPIRTNMTGTNGSSMERNTEAITLPGYTAERDVQLGRNVVLERGTQVEHPVLLNDDVWCARNVRIDRDVIIGRGAFVGEGAHLLRTIVCDETYIGTGLEIVDKIVVGSRIIDAEAGSWIDLDEKGVVHGINQRGTGWMRKIVNFLYGRSRGKRN